MKSTLLLLSACVCLLSITPVSSHHGRPNFLYDVKKTLEGKITYYRWRNPHTYLEIETKNKNNETESWVIEAGTPTALRKLGWEKNSLKLGDIVTLVGNPDRNPDKKILLLDHVIREDGETFYVASRLRPPPPKKITKRLANLPSVIPSEDLSGTWMRGPNNYLTGSYYVPPSDWPLTKLGEEQAARFDRFDNPSYVCQERGMPFFTVKNYNFLWTLLDDRIVITQQQYVAIRTIYLNQDKHPDDLKPSLMGHSIGHFDNDGNLLVDTVGFPAGVKWGLATSVESSEQKHIIERFTLDEDGLGVTFSLTIEDPVYLTEPVIVNGTYYKVPEVPYETYVCDIEAAQKGL